VTPFTTSVQVRWGDLDAYGHVNNAAFLTILEAGRVAWLRDLVDLEDASTGFVIRRLELDFLLPIGLDDSPVEVVVAVEAVGTSSVTLRERISTRTGALLADARSVLVHIDRVRVASAPIPDGLRARLAGQLGDEAARDPT
jgi:acyl-CoA thioester hydrolase